MKIEQNLEIPDFFIVLKNLENVESKSTTKIHQETKISYAHVHKIQKMLVSRNLITVQRILEAKKKYNVVALTDDGHKMVAYINEILRMLNISELDLLTLQANRKKTRKEEKQNETLHTSESSVPSSPQTTTTI